MSADRLNSWKEIAAHLGRDVTTVQRWEKREGMPVHRHLHDRIGSVYAFRSELEAWAASRRQKPPAVVEPVEAAPRASGSSRRFRLVAVAAAAAVVVVIGVSLWLRESEFFWTSPIANAQFLRVTDFDGSEQAAAISPDGRFVTFLSDRDGPTDVWITRIGSGEFHNLTRGAAPALLNPSVRMLSFSPDSAFVTFWVGRPADTGSRAIGIWSVSTFGGAPRPLLEGVAEADYSPDGKRLVYHTTGPGDPMFVTDAARTSEGRPVFVAPAGSHAHYPRWSPDGRFIYFVLGALPDKLDIWRIRPEGGAAEQITRHKARVEHPVLLDARTIVYLAADVDGSGPWLYSMDVERRVPRKLGSGADRYTSLSASADARRLVTTLANPRRTLWRVRLDGAGGEVGQDAARLPVTTGTGFSPRFGPGYLVYVSSNGAGERLWKVADGAATVLWSGEDAHVIGRPAVTRDGQRVAFSIRQDGRTVLRIVDADGTNGRVVTRSLELEGAPAWAPDGESIVTAVMENGIPHLVRVWLDDRPPSPLVREYSTDPVWAPDGSFVLYSGPDIGTTFGVRAVTADARPHPLPPLTLTRGARHLAFVPGRRALVFLRGEIHHKNLWLLDLETGAERQLTDFAADFEIRDFDISPDGREAIVERAQEQSDIVLLELTKS
jgi:Tol biopolymer transport system component